MSAKIFLITGNEEQQNFNLLLRSLTLTQKQNDKNPLIINFNRNCFYSEPNRFLGNDKNIYKKLFDYYTESNIQTISIEKLYTALQKNKYDFEAIENKFSHIYLNYNNLQEEYKNLLKIVDNYIVVLKAGNEISNYMFKLLKDNKDNLKQKHFNIIISNTKKIEETAKFFLKIKNEMLEMLGDSVNLNFIGPLLIDKEKAGISLLIGQPHIRIFFEGAFHGNVKYIDERLTEAPYQKQESLFFKRLLHIAKK